MGTDTKENILVSACLLGMNCRYDGGCNEEGWIEELQKNYHLIPVCPEIYGELCIPREPSELVGGRVIGRDGSDVTEAFERGARETLKLAVRFHCSYAILKERSPSCGRGVIYDGSFTGRLTQGDGITARLLMENGIQVFGESDLAGGKFLLGSDPNRNSQ